MSVCENARKDQDEKLLERDAGSVDVNTVVGIINVAGNGIKGTD